MQMAPHSSRSWLGRHR